MATTAAAGRARRTPQDRKPKAADGVGSNGKFSFTHKGKTYTFPKPMSDVRAPAFQRANRRRDQIDLVYTVIEHLADDDQSILDAIDSMTEAEFQALNLRMGKALQSAIDNPGPVGESEGS